MQANIPRAGQKVTSRYIQSSRQIRISGVMRFRPIVPLLIAAASLYAHPMGNFSINHYANFEVSAAHIDVCYVLDLAEIPTFELLRDWKLDRTSPGGELDRRAKEQARAWAQNLVFADNGKATRPIFESAKLVIADGAGNLPIVRITSHFRLNAAPGHIEYEDRNFPDRAGWKELVIRGGKDARIEVASQGPEERSKALTEYPRDPTVAPPQDLRASFQWVSTKQAPAVTTVKPAVIKAVPQPTGPRAAAPATMTPQAAPAGAVVRGDFLSRMLHQRELTWGMILIALLVAFGLGAAHALTPGHGKTIVAAYLVGSRGTLKHAAFLGAMVTFTHTVTVFLLGLATLFLFRYVMPEKITQALGAISGLSIVAIGAWMVRKRIRAARHARNHHHDHHHHDHAHDHHHHDGHGHAHDHYHDHDHAHGHHHHHIPELSWGGLVALGASGGLVPCESALILLLSAIALGRIGLGLVLLLAFSFGLAIVLMGIGMIVLFAKHLLTQKGTTNAAAFRWIPIFSGGVVVCVGLVMTAVSLGWIEPKWMIG